MAPKETWQGALARRFEAKASAAADEAERIDKRREAIEGTKRGNVWKRRQVRPLGFALSVLSRKAVKYMDRAEALRA